MSDWKQELSDLIDRAEREGKWLRTFYQDICVTPAELRAANAKGRFVWGVVNWELIDPQSRVDAAAQRLSEAQRDLDTITAKVAGR